MGERAKDDGFDLPRRGKDRGADDGSGAGESGLDVDLQFLEDVESMDVEGMAGVTTRKPATRMSDGMTADDVAEFRARWADVQASFIDDPSRACEQADNLVDLVLTRLTERFARERDELVRKWDRGHEPTETEDLRLAMKGYRALIDRLLTTEL